MKEQPGEVVPQEIHDNIIEFKPTLNYFNKANDLVGYANLDLIHHGIDTEKILKKGLDNYPCLCILHYRDAKGQATLEMRSAKFQLNQTKVEITQKNIADIGQLLNQLAGQVLAATG